MGATGRLRRSGLCSLVCTMRNLEVDSNLQGAEDLGCFWTFTEAAVMGLAKKMGKDEVTSLEDLPSYAEVKEYADMRVEAFSLRMTRIVPASIVMSKAEVKAAIEAQDIEVPDDTELPGTEEHSKFFEVFPPDAVAAEASS